VPYDLKRQPRTESQPAESVRVGEELRDARLALGISLEEMAEQLRINRRYLAALEEGRVKDLPGLAYGTGFVRSYAQSIGLDSQDLVRRFREGAGAQARAKDLVFPEPVPERGVPAGAVIMVGAVLAIGAYAAWYQWSGSAERHVDAVPPLPPRLEQAAGDAGLPPLPGVPPVTTPAPNAAPGPTTPAAPGQAGLLPPGPPTPGQPRPSQAPNQGAVPQGGAPQGGVAQGGGAQIGLGPAGQNGQLAQGQPGQGNGAGQAAGAARPAAALPGGPNGAAPAAPPPPAAGSGPATPATSPMVLRATQEVWIQIRDPKTGRTVISRVLRPSETYEVPPIEGLLLTTGKAEGLTVEVNGTPSPAFTQVVGVKRDIALDADRLRNAQPGQLPVR
jgi:cytoskeleton protein RodZ